MRDRIAAPRVGLPHRRAEQERAAPLPGSRCTLYYPTQYWLSRYPFGVGVVAPLFFLMTPRPPRSPLFPHTTPFRSRTSTVSALEINADTGSERGGRSNS